MVYVVFPTLEQVARFRDRVRVWLSIAPSVWPDRVLAGCGEIFRLSKL